MKLKTLLTTVFMASLGIVAEAQPVAHFDMSPTNDGRITESVSQTSYAIASQLPACTVADIDGEALCRRQGRPQLHVGS